MKFLIRLANKYPEVYTELIDSARLAGGKVEKLVSSIRQEIDNITSDPAWRNHWSDEGNPSDFSRVKSMMLTLFDQGYNDAVTTIAGELLDKGNSYVETCDDEGDSAVHISDCLEIGFKAVEKCEWPNVRKIVFIIEAELQDEYDLCGNTYEILESIRDKPAWSAAADDLSDRLAHLSSAKNANNEFSTNYRRDRIGTAMNPVDHPHGGGEGRTFGKHPVTPWGVQTKGKKTRTNKRTDGMIVRRRNAK